MRGRELKSVAKTEAVSWAPFAPPLTWSLPGAIGDGPSAFRSARGRLTELLTLRECRFQHGQLGRSTYVRWRRQKCQWAGSMWDVERAGLSSGLSSYDAMCNNRAFGRFVLTFEPGVSPADPTATGRRDHSPIRSATLCRANSGSRPYAAGTQSTSDLASRAERSACRGPSRGPAIVP